MIIFIPIHSIYKLNGRLDYNDIYLEISTAVQQKTVRTDRLIVEEAASSPRIFYYSQRKGWAYSIFDKITPSRLEDLIKKGAAHYCAKTRISSIDCLEALIKKGATHYVMAVPKPNKINPELHSFLKSNYQLILQEENVTIFKLSKN